MHPEATAVATVPVVSAEELHQELLKAFTLSNRVRRRFIEALRAMAEAKLYLTFGFSSIAGYAEKYFSLSRSQTYELLRVGEALRDLPRLDEAFGEGRLSWSLVREISRVATADTEGEWLQFKDEHTVAELRAEARDALEKKRTRPRHQSYGLPSLIVDVAFKLQNDEYERVKKAFGKLQDELGDSLGGDRSDWKAALLYLSDRILETDAPESLGGRVEGKDSPYTILYHCCPQCRSAKLATADGLAEVPSEVVERVAGEAKRVEISPEEELPRKSEETERDPKNPPWLVEKVKLRDGGTCSNPLCARRLGLHAHHIVFRAKGGKTALSNETLICSVCHSLCHQGLLEIAGSPATGVRFEPRGAATSVRDFTLELEALASSAKTFVVEPSRRERACGSGSERIRHSESPGVDTDMFEDLVSALRNLGYSARGSRERIERAVEKLQSAGEESSSEKILKAALRSQPPQSSRGCPSGSSPMQ